MARALLRKLTDVTSAEDLGSITELLKANRIFSEFHIGTRQDSDTFRIWVNSRDLEAARGFLAGWKAYKEVA